MQIYEDVSQIFNKIVSSNNLKTNVWDWEEYNFTNKKRLSEDNLQLLGKILDEFRHKLSEKLQIDLNNILGCIKFQLNKLSEAIDYFSRKINSDSYDSINNLLECYLLDFDKFKCEIKELYPIKSRNKDKYYTYVYDLIVRFKCNIELFEEYLQSKDEDWIKNPNELNNIEEKLKKKDFSSFKLLKFLTVFYKENRRFKESIEIYKKINDNYPYIKSLDNIKILLQSADCNYLFFNDLDICLQNLNQALQNLPFIDCLSNQDKAIIKANIYSKKICVLIESYNFNKDLDNSINKLRKLLIEYSKDIPNSLELELALTNNLIINKEENNIEYTKTVDLFNKSLPNLKNKVMKNQLLNSLLYLYYLKNDKELNNVHEEFKNKNNSINSYLNTNNNFEEIYLKRSIKIRILNDSVISVENETFIKNSIIFNKNIEDIKDRLEQVINNFNYYNALDVYFLFNYANYHFSLDIPKCLEYFYFLYRILEKNYNKIGLFISIIMINTFLQTLTNNKKIEEVIKIHEEFENWFKAEITNYTKKTVKIKLSEKMKNEFIKFFKHKCDILLKLKLYDNALDQFKNLEKIFCHFGLQNDIRCLVLTFDIGYCYLLKDSYSEAKSYFELAKSVFEDCCDKEKIDCCDKLLNIISKKNS